VKILVLLLLSFSFAAQALPKKRQVQIIVTGSVKYTGDSYQAMCAQAGKKATALAFNICDRFPSKLRPLGTLKKCDISKTGEARQDLVFHCTKKIKATRSARL
jgi:hypothetical protein